MNQITPAQVFHPGTYLKEELATRKRTQKMFANLIKKSENEVSELISGKRNISPRRALLLWVAFETSPHVWLNLQNIYDIYQEESWISNLLQEVKSHLSKYTFQIDHF